MSGNRTLTRLSGVVSIVSLTVATENQYANNVLPDGILVKKSDGVIYRTDGIHAVRDLIPVADQVLTYAEKVSLNIAFSTGLYTAASGGVVVHDNNGKINDNSLNVVSSGKIKPSYLSDFIDNGMVKYAVLPEDVKNSFIVVNTYDDLRNISIENRKKLVVVIDTSTDPSTSAGGNGIYYYHNNGWHSVIAVANAEVTYENVQAVSGVMYDHPLHLMTDSANIHDILDALVIGEVAPDEPEDPGEPDDPTPPDPPNPDDPDPDDPNPDDPDPDEPDPIDTGHDETAEYMEAGWEDFIASVNSMLAGPSGDVYLQDAADNYSKSFTTIQGGDLDLLNTTVTITNTTTNAVLTLTVTELVQNDQSIGVLPYDREDPAVRAFIEYDDYDVGYNQQVHLVATDGTHTYTTDEYLYHYFDSFPALYVDNWN